MKKILITGITGYIGGSIAKKLLDKNYEVTGLVRNESHIQQLESLGIRSIIGDIYDEDFIQSAVANADAVIHNADSADDAYSADNFLKALEGSHKTFIFTSGSAIFGGKENGKKSNFIFREDFPLHPRLEMASRVLINNHVLQSAQKGIKSIVIVPTMVYGEGLGIKKAASRSLPSLIFLKRKDMVFTLEKVKISGPIYILKIWQTCMCLRWKKQKQALFIMQKTVHHP